MQGCSSRRKRMNGNCANCALTANFGKFKTRSGVRVTLSLHNIKRHNRPTSLMSALFFINKFSRLRVHLDIIEF